MRTTHKSPGVAYDHEAKCFRVVEPPAPRVVNREDRPAVAKESVSRLLAQAFGRTLRSGATVPAHLRKYVK